jgi:hypothetical protein
VAIRTDWPAPLGIQPLRENRVVLVDARDLDPAEEIFLATSAVRRSTVGELQPDDLPGGPVLLHVDVDVINASEVGSVPSVWQHAGLDNAFRPPRAAKSPEVEGLGPRCSYGGTADAAGGRRIVADDGDS